MGLKKLIRTEIDFVGLLWTIRWHYDDGTVLIVRRYVPVYPGC